MPKPTMQTVREALQERTEHLSPMETALLQLLAVVAEPVDHDTLIDIYRKTGLSFPDETGGPVRTLLPQLRRLRIFKLISPTNVVHEAIEEIIVRLVFADTKTKVFPPAPASSDASSRRGRKSTAPKTQPVPAPVSLATALVRTVRLALPAPSTYWSPAGKKTTVCPRYLREMRIALHEKDAQRLEASYNALYTYCDTRSLKVNPLVRLVHNPFDGAWFSTLPAEWQVRLLSLIFSNTITRFDSDNEALAYALNPALRAGLSNEWRAPFTYNLAVRLILGGHIGQARRLLDEMVLSQTKSDSFGLYGWIAFLEGHLEESLKSFEADLKELRRRQNRRNIFFSGLGGFFFILALLRKGDADSLRKAGQYLEQVRNRSENPALMAPVHAALEAILASLAGEEPEAAARPIAFYSNDWKLVEGSMGILFVAMALFWVNGQLGLKDIDALSNLFIRSREAGLNWLAMECAELLCRADDETPIRRNTVLKIREETGLTPFTATIEAEQRWQKSLRALKVAAEGAKGRNTPAALSQTRIIYLLRFHREELVGITPVEQKLTARGMWSKGRPIALQRLASGDRLEGLTEADQPLRAALRREGYYHVQYEFDMKRALPALVGHPRLFLENSHQTPVEVLKDVPEIMVRQKGDELVVTFYPDVSGDERHVLVRETPTRYRVIELSEAHHQVARILGQSGLAIPASAQEEVSGVLAEVSSLVTVHSTIPGTAHSIETLPADSTPCVHLLPYGDGFRLEIFVKPFKEGGPYLKPGQGAENLMADVGGRRCQTQRNLKEEKARASAMERGIPILASLPEMDGQWFLESPEDALQALLEMKEAQDRGEAIVEWPEGERLRVSKALSFSNLQLRIRNAANWFEVEGELRVDEERVIDMRQLIEMLSATPHRFLPLGDGQFVAITQELRRRLDELAAYADKRGKKVGVHPLAALALSDLTEQVGGLDADQEWFDRLKRIREGLTLSPAVPSTLKAQLRDYQLEGYRWLARLAHLGFGACLADDMGLGKTIQALAVILLRAPQGPALVVAPTSVCANWMNEAQRFAPTLNVVPFGGNNRESVVAGLGPFDVLVSSYGLLHQESKLLGAKDWQTIILDEAQAIKNIATKRSQAAMNLKGAFKVVTTGTPIENHLSEFWTLFNFINAGLLGPRERFNTRFAIPIERYNDREARRRLKKLVQPFILRRLKSQVLEELPPRTEVVLQVELSAEETAFYEALRRKAMERIEAEEGPAAQKHMQILAEITRLRRACCHPRLVLPESPISSAKLDLFGDVVSELLENGHKALVFSQFVGHLTLIREFLDGRSIPYRYLDGSTPPKERQREVEAFQSGEGDLFLISLKAGGLGLNLTAADYVIHMDPWWNPAVEDQASDRAHRIGQERPVTVYRLVARKTIEEKIVRLHAEKRDLADSLLEGSDVSGKISADDLLQLIREP